MHMPFGKFAGEDIEDIPSDYLRWFIDNIDADSSFLEEVINACDDEYNFREKHREHFYKTLRSEQ